MTKKEMITKLQLREAATWLAFRNAKASRGDDDWFTNKLRSEWCAVNRTLEEVGVPADHQLPQNLEALELCMQESRERRAACEAETEDILDRI